MKKVNGKKDVYAIVNEKILEKLQQNTLPWRQTWNSFEPARNYVSGKPYRGINALLLNLCISSEYPLYLTFNQAKELGGTVKKGSKGNMVVFWKKLYYGPDGKIDVRRLGEFDPEDVTEIPYLRYYYVFNIDYIEGVECKLPERNNPLLPLEACERIVNEMPKAPVIEHGGDEAYYHKVKDFVKVPKLSNFNSSESYYEALFHELSHSTGHASRLNRDMSGAFGSKQYSFEELIAEISACFLCNEVGIADQVIDNSTAYIKHWLELLTDILKEDMQFWDPKRPVSKFHWGTYELLDESKSMLPQKIIKPLKEHLNKVKIIQEEDLKNGFGTVYLSYALKFQLTRDQ